jgi:hypothetical protein
MFLSVWSSRTRAHKNSGLLMVSDAAKIIKSELYSGILSGAQCGKDHPMKPL